MPVLAVPVPCGVALWLRGKVLPRYSAQINVILLALEISKHNFIWEASYCNPCKSDSMHGPQKSEGVRSYKTGPRSCGKLLTAVSSERLFLQREENILVTELGPKVHASTGSPSMLDWLSVCSGTCGAMVCTASWPGQGALTVPSHAAYCLSEMHELAKMQTFFLLDCHLSTRKDGFHPCSCFLLACHYSAVFVAFLAQRSSVWCCGL